MYKYSTSESTRHFTVKNPIRPTVLLTCSRSSIDVDDVDNAFISRCDDHLLLAVENDAAASVKTLVKAKSHFLGIRRSKWNIAPLTCASIRNHVCWSNVRTWRGTHTTEQDRATPDQTPDHASHSFECYSITTGSPKLLVIWIEYLLHDSPTGCVLYKRIITRLVRAEWIASSKRLQSLLHL